MPVRRVRSADEKMLEEMLVVANWGSHEVSPADIGGGPGGIPVPGTAQNGAALTACVGVCGGGAVCEEDGLTPFTGDRVPWVLARLEQGLSNHYLSSGLEPTS